MIVIVCGDREWPESLRPYLEQVLDSFHARHNITLLREGEARGADRQARDWAVKRGIPVDPFPADWDLYRPRVRGRKNPAGPIRNRQMAKEVQEGKPDYMQGKPEYVLAFHTNPSISKGTRDMVSVATKLGIPHMWLPSVEYPVADQPTGQPGPLQPDRNAVPDPLVAVTRANPPTPPPPGTAPGIGGVPTPEEVVDLDHAPQIADIEEP